MTGGAARREPAGAGGAGPGEASGASAARRWPDIDPLERAVLPRRVARLDAVLTARLGSVRVVCEDLFDPHNVGACMRTAEGFGIQDFHVITAKHGFRGPGDVARSADQWLTLHRHRDSAEAIGALRAAGFAIWVSDLDAASPLRALPVQGQVALVVGNESEGISDAMRAAADHRFVLPMHGMVQSYNLSVALAMSLDHVVGARRAELLEGGAGGDLPLSRQWELRQRWLEYGVRAPAKVRAAFAVAAPGFDATMLAEQAAEAGRLEAATARLRSSWSRDKRRAIETGAGG